MHEFTQEQLQIGRLIEEGLTYDEMAARMGANPRTVKAKTDKIRWMLGVKRKRQIPKVMRDLGLLK